MNTITFGNAFSIRYKHDASSQGETHRPAEAEQARKEAKVGDSFARLVQEGTGQEARRVAGPQGDLLLMDGPQGKTLSVYKELEKGLGKGADPKEQAENTQIILETMQKKGVLSSSPKSVTLLYGPGHAVDKEQVKQKFKEMGFPIGAKEAAEEASATKSDAPKSYANVLKRSYSSAFQTQPDRSGA